MRAEGWKGREALNPIAKLVDDAKNSPECFECKQPIMEFGEVRVVTVRVDGKPMDVWMHAKHVNPSTTKGIS